LLRRRIGRPDRLARILSGPKIPDPTVQSRGDSGIFAALQCGLRPAGSSTMSDDHGIEERLAGYRPPFNLAGPTPLSLGAAPGIGKASAEALAALGATVICADRNRDGVEATAADLRRHGRSEAHVVDAGNAEDIRALAAAVRANHQRLDIAVTTPAIHVRKLMLDYTDEEYDRVANLNLRGTFYFLRAFGRLMIEQRGGSLIASSSVRATTLEPGLAIYGATKAG